MSVLHWVRHGPTHAKTMIGWTDRPADLSDTAAIARLSDYLPAHATLVSSDLCRASATADALALPDRARLPHVSALREIHFGAWEDRTFDDVSADEPDAIAAFWQRPGPSPATNGESWDQLHRRISAAADHLARAGGDIIIVAHFGAILTQLQRARGLGPSDIFAQKIDPLSVTRLRKHGDVWIEELANHRP